MFDDLSEELQIHIFSFLNSHKNQLRIMSLVSKKWYRLANDVGLWKQILKQETQYRCQKNLHPKTILFKLYKLNKYSAKQIAKFLGDFSTLSSKSKIYPKAELTAELINGTPKLLTKLAELDVSTLWDTLIMHFAELYYAEDVDSSDPDCYRGPGVCNPKSGKILDDVLRIPQLAHKLTFEDMYNLIACASRSPEIFLHDKIIMQKLSVKQIYKLLLAFDQQCLYAYENGEPEDVYLAAIRLIDGTILAKLGGRYLVEFIKFNNFSIECIENLTKNKSWQKMLTANHFISLIKITFEVLNKNMSFIRKSLEWTYTSPLNENEKENLFQHGKDINRNCVCLQSFKELIQNRNDLAPKWNFDVEKYQNEFLIRARELQEQYQKKLDEISNFIRKEEQLPQPQQLFI